MRGVEGDGGCVRGRLFRHGSDQDLAATTKSSTALLALLGGFALRLLSLLRLLRILLGLLGFQLGVLLRLLGVQLGILLGLLGILLCTLLRLLRLSSAIVSLATNQ